MIEPLLVPSQGIWPGNMPWVGPPALPTSSAPMLVAAVAMQRGRPQGPGSDQDVEELVYDTIELLQGSGDVDVRCESGRVTLSGAVSHKRLKHDIGEIAWAIPFVGDVQNNITIASRRRTRSFAREGESQPVAAGRKQA